MATSQEDCTFTTLLHQATTLDGLVCPSRSTSGSGVLKTALSICLALFVVISLPTWAPAQAATVQADARPSLAELDAEAAQAKQRVLEIVNRPVTRLPRTQAAFVYSPGWFHPGAIKPDFDTVDVRSTQMFIYDTQTYVTSDQNPSEMFLGSELEFNAMTKYFYADRTLPKRKLSEPEMIEINSLYRVIGHDEDAHAARRELIGVVILGFILAVSLFVLVRRMR